MILSHCCGAPTHMTYLSDDPFVYDDVYDLQTPVPVCLKCKQVIGPIQPKPPRNDIRKTIRLKGGWKCIYREP
ncbi:hypothetical protein J2Z37_003847 [Ammoniphilus resinae]|uniref:Uncharacterized protein n=1 Tax=Ammoniphilus resinae TaxID=861532 RepID=A0ABS4GUB2_9BACL|nr:hypothetical protein [Ammoniphilus resinae]